MWLTVVIVFLLAFLLPPALPFVTLAHNHEYLYFALLLFYILFSYHFIYLLVTFDQLLQEMVINYRYINICIIDPHAYLFLFCFICVKKQDKCASLTCWPMPQYLRFCKMLEGKKESLCVIKDWCSAWRLQWNPHRGNSIKK